MRKTSLTVRNAVSSKIVKPADGGSAPDYPKNLIFRPAWLPAGSFSIRLAKPVLFHPAMAPLIPLRRHAPFSEGGAPPCLSSNARAALTRGAACDSCPGIFTPRRHPITQMKSLPRPLQLLAAFAALFSSAALLPAATADVTLSGSTWTGKVDGVTKYTGTSMAGAVYACSSVMGSGTINVKNSGSTGEMRIYNQVLDGWGCTFTGSGSGGIVKAQNVSSTGAKNMKMAGSPWFGAYFSTCNGQTFSGISGGAGILMRIDNCKGGTGYNFNGGSPTGTASGSHAVETYGINNVTLGTVTATDRGECGLLVNAGTTARVTTVNATRCCYGGGYAGLRYANTAVDAYASGTTTSTSCGRGFFSLTGSNNSAVAKLNASGCSGIGIWIQDCVKVRVVSGTLSNNGGGCYSVSGSGSYANVTCN